MEIYDVNLVDEDRLRKPRPLVAFVICFAVTPPVSLLFDWLLPNLSLASHWLGHRAPFDAGEVILMVVMWGLWSLVMSVYFSSKKFGLAVTQPWQAYQIIVEENQIRTRNFNSYNRMLAKAIQRGTVRTIVEKEKGLLISSRGRIGTFLCGGIWIPKRLADYEYLKRLTLNWKMQEPA